MKSVLISIQPKWVEKIASGEKTIEVRKSRPKIETPFKCYIYCTKAEKTNTLYYMANIDLGRTAYNGKVIGEFICDKIDSRWFYISADGVPITDIEKDFETLSCLKRKEIINYALQPNKALKVHNGTMFIYGWHISNLKIYDKPKELGEFKSVCYEQHCKLFYDRDCDKETCSFRKIKRPPQSWCYVESLGE